MSGQWHRWQLTAPLAALSRPVRTRNFGEAIDSGPALAAGAVSGTPASGPSAAAGGAAGPTRQDRAAARADTGLPVLLGGARARQHDPTSCAPAVLVMLAATGDPDLAAWLETGRLPDGPPPPEIPADAVHLDAAGRFAAAQRHVKERATRRALGPLRWPGALGIPPWAVAREARYPGVRYRVRPLDDSSAEAPTILTLVEDATRRGHPVPLYTGGDLRGGLAQAVPRHLVLAVPPPRGAGVPGVLQVYEPAAGSVFAVPTEELLDRTEPLAALGGWTHVSAVLLPVPA